MLDKPFILDGVFWDTNDEDIDNAEDGEKGEVTIYDDEIICITSPNGIEVRLTLYELEAILEFAYASEINDIRDNLDLAFEEVPLESFDPFRKNK